MPRNPIFFTFLLPISLLLVTSCHPEPQKKKMKVTATAFNSLPYQTRRNSSGNITAWGDTLKEGMKCIAVSRDLLDSGLTHNKKVWIEGLNGIYLVKDKMNRRWEKKIDIYFGRDVQKAREWGKKEVVISFFPEEKGE